jgi:hypothetical protein
VKKVIKQWKISVEQRRELVSAIRKAIAAARDHSEACAEIEAILSPGKCAGPIDRLAMNLSIYEGVDQMFVGGLPSRLSVYRTRRKLEAKAGCS